MGRKPLILWDVVEEHLDEAEFLWARREAAIASPDHSLRDVELGVEERLLAQIDGLVSAGPAAAERLLVPALAESDPGRVAAAAFALIATPGDAGLSEVLGAIRAASPVARRSLVSALGLSDREDVSARLTAALGAEAPEVRAAALSALAFGGVDPGRSLVEITAADPPDLILAGLRAARGSKERSLAALAAAHFASPDPALRVEAIRAGLVLGLPGALAACQKLAGARVATSGEAIALLALVGDARDQEAILAAVGDAATRNAAIEALGHSGRAIGAEACLPILHDEGDEIAQKLAGEAFMAITGAPREALSLSAETRREAIEPRPLAEEALGERAVPPPEAGLPLLDPVKTETWWRDHRSSFDRQTRYLLGEPLRAESVLGAIQESCMRRRHSLALELAIRSRGRFQVETRALAARQRNDIRRLGRLDGIEFSRAAE